jgi:hypothetical protein
MPSPLKLPLRPPMPSPLKPLLRPPLATPLNTLLLPLRPPRRSNSSCVEKANPRVGFFYVCSIRKACRLQG